MSDSDSQPEVVQGLWGNLEASGPPSSEDQIANRVAYDRVVQSGADDDHFSAEDPEFARIVRLLNETLTGGWPQTLAGLSGVPPDFFAEASETTAPQSLGRFEIQDKIGSGTFGIVWRAWDPLLRRIVAVKVPRPEIRMDVEVSRRFLREARAAARLNHPGIVRVLDAGIADGVAYLAAEYVEGESLGELLGRVEWLPIDEAATLVRSLADAISHAHQHGVLHRDIKPDNVLMVAPGLRTEGDPVPRLTDFGLAQIVDDEDGRSRAGLVIGTPNYMAPEVLAGEANDYGPTTDVFSLGVVLYEALTGRDAIAQDSGPDLNRAANRRFDSLRRVRAEIPRDLESICLKCVEREPRNRYATADELCADLDRFLHGKPTLARPLPMSERIGRWCVGNIAAATAFTAVALSLVIVAGISWSSRNFERTQNELLQIALKEKNTEREKAINSEAKFRKLAWTTGLQQAYSHYGEGDLISSSKALQAMKLSHTDAGRHPEWKLLQLELDEQFQVFPTSDVPLDEVVHVPGTQKVVVAGTDGLLRFIDLDSGITTEFEPGISSIHALAVKTDGTQLAVGGTPNSLTGACPVLIDLPTLATRTLTMVGTSTIESLSYSPDGSRLAVGHRYQGVTIVPTGDKSAWKPVKLKGDRRNWSVAWIPKDDTGPELLVTSRDFERIQLTDRAGTVQSEIVRQRGISCFVQMPRTREVITAIYRASVLQITRTIDGRTRRVLDNCPADIRCIAATSAHEWVAVGLVDGRVVVWNARHDQPGDHGDPPATQPFTTVRLHEGAVTSMCWVGSRLVTVGEDGRTTVFDVPGETPRRHDILGDVTAVSFIGGSDEVLVGMRDGHVYRVDASVLQELSRDSANEAPTAPGRQSDALQRVGMFDTAVRALASSADGSVFGVGTDDCTLRIVDSSNNAVLHTFHRPEAKQREKQLQSIVFSKTADRVYWADNYRIYGESLNGQQASLDVEGQNIRSLILSTDESWIGAAGIAEGVRRYDSHSGRQLSRPVGSQWCEAMTWHGGSLITGERDGTIRVYNGHDWQLQNLLRAHSTSVTRILLCDNSGEGLSIDSNSRICTWDLSTGSVFGSLMRTESANSILQDLWPDLAMSDDRRWLVTLSDRSPESTTTATVRVYDLQSATSSPDSRQGVGQARGLIQ